jgi:hypothetical protein
MDSWFVYNRYLPDLINESIINDITSELMFWTSLYCVQKAAKSFKRKMGNAVLTYI